MIVAFEDIKTGIDILRQFLVPRAFTARLTELARKEGILSVVREMKKFTKQEFCDTVEKRLGYKTDDAVRKRMLIVLLDFLEECGHISQDLHDIYTCNGDVKSVPSLSTDEMKTMGKIFGGQVAFFDRCIDYAGDFLRGSDYLYSFEKGMEQIWDRYLENYEFSIARNILLKAITINKIPNCKIMDLCFGTGHDLEVICRNFPDADITAIDFTDAMRLFVMSKMGNNSAKIQWIDASRWRGFGNNLPFEDMIFDRVLFSCSDPYIPEHEREGVYRNIFRILKPGGILGVIAWGYPDRTKKHIQNNWVRKYIYIHDFAESVCRGWYGFHEIGNTIKMARDIGFVEANGLSNGFYMLNSAIWIFKRP